MKYFLDSEFIENGGTIDLISIALVCEDGREFYRQNSDAKFQNANDWVWRNVFPHLQHFHMRGDRSCQPLPKISTCHASDCPWRSRAEIRDEIADFCHIPTYGKPVFWGFYSSYDWIAFCQLFGSMTSLPEGYPQWCRDLKQWCVELDDPKLPEQGKGEHNALLDARWNKRVYEFLHLKATGQVVVKP